MPEGRRKERVGATFEWGHLRDRAAYREWALRQPEADPPGMLVPAHGSVLVDPELSVKLRQLLVKRI